MRMIYIMASLAVLMLVGCNLNLPTQPDSKKEATGRWQLARAQVITGVGNEHLKTGDLEKAQICASEALRLSDQLVPARVLMARTLIEKGQYGQAVDQLALAEKISPKVAQVHYLKGVALEKQNECEAALASYVQAQELDSANNAYACAAAEALVSLNRPEEAYNGLAARLEKSDGDPSMLRLTGELAMLANRPAQAVEYFQRCLDAQPDSLLVRESLAKARYFARQYRPAVEDLAILARSDGYRDRAAWVYIMTGDCYMALDMPRDARAAYETASGLDPADARIWTSLARAALSAQDPVRAASSARRALSLDARSSQALAVLGYALLRQDKADQALQELSSAGQQVPATATLQCIQGRCLEKLGRHAEAMDCYVLALKTEPASGLAKALLASADAKPTPGAP